MNRKDLGSWGEKIAVGYLKKHGYQIVETNFRCRQGEIDIIAQDNEYLVFIEVRTRKGYGFGTPEESVNVTKQKKLVSLAFAYLQTHRNHSSLWRFDVVAVELDRKGKIARLELIQDAIN